MNANDGSTEPSPFLPSTVGVPQEDKQTPSSPDRDEQVYLESLYNSMLKQQEWLSIEIKKIQKVCNYCVICGYFPMQLTKGVYANCRVCLKREKSIVLEVLVRARKI